MSEDKSKVILSIMKGKDDQDKVGEGLKRSYKIEDRTILEWEEFFRIHIPEDPYPAECRQILIMIGNRYEEATRLSREYQIRKQLLQAIYEAQYNSSFVEEYNEALGTKCDGGRMPSKEVLERKAKERTTEYEDMMIHADVIHQFFKQITDKLGNQRKIIEGISITHGIEAKLAPLSSSGGSEDE